jgi:hypothetical protein
MTQLGQGGGIQIAKGLTGLQGAGTPLVLGEVVSMNWSWGASDGAALIFGKD